MNIEQARKLAKDYLQKYNNSNVYRKFSVNTLSILAKHPNINCKILRELLEHKDNLIRSSALSNPKTPQYIVEEWGLSFLETLNQRELGIIASNIYAPDIILEQLIQHQNHSIVFGAISNPCISDRIFKIWENSKFYKVGFLARVMVEEQKLLDTWKLSLSGSNRLTILLNTQTPIPILAKISRSTSWLERYAIAQNPKTPLSIIQRLTEDSNRIVRAAAKTRLETQQ